MAQPRQRLGEHELACCVARRPHTSLPCAGSAVENPDQTRREPGYSISPSRAVKRTRAEQLSTPVDPPDHLPTLNP
jgi:hypothetical protein